MLVWWVRWTCDGEVDRILGKVGDFVEEAVFGGSVQRWRKMGNAFGDYTTLSDIAIVAGDNKMKLADLALVQKFHKAFFTGLKVPFVDFAIERDLTPASNAATFLRRKNKYQQQPQQ
ncbi:hypothetical protein Hypma_010789 [Hypsizygus marmoreus]|uniref:Uncharacterized protein n=1 Tax=Hypsizygus marmoreus TaxID=39966 RepID=A0A369JIA6_HYPMA|nr:hypothetical protein Hypma_010789 [Hypsizygus marmoreus]